MSGNRPKTDKRPAPRTAFQPGQSGNPSGRPKRTAEEFHLIQACKTQSPEALATITHLMNTADKDNVRLSAAVFIIERAYGKPVAKLEDPNPLADLPTPALMALLNWCREQAAVAEASQAHASAGVTSPIQGRA